MSKIKLICLDLDGVIYVGENLIKCADFFIKKLIECNIPYVFVTNSTLFGRDFYAKKLCRLGIPADPEKIITAAYATYKYIKRKSKKCDQCLQMFILGEEGLRKELSRLNCRFLTEKDKECADYVIVGLDRKINYEKLCKATWDILAGARFIAVNNDALWPVENGVMPGVGVFVAALRTATGKRPYVVGKPNTFMLKLVLQKARIKPNELLMVGDKLDSDILMGKRIGALTALVLTGVTSKEQAQKAKGNLKPDIIAKDLCELWRFLEEKINP